MTNEIVLVGKALKLMTDFSLDQNLDGLANGLFELDNCLVTSNGLTRRTHDGQRAIQIYHELKSKLPPEVQELYSFKSRKSSDSGEFVWENPNRQLSQSGYKK